MKNECKTLAHGLDEPEIETCKQFNRRTRGASAPPSPPLPLSPKKKKCISSIWYITTSDLFIVQS